MPRASAFMEKRLSCPPSEKDTPAGSAGEAGEPGKAVGLEMRDS